VENYFHKVFVWFTLQEPNCRASWAIHPKFSPPVLAQLSFCSFLPIEQMASNMEESFLITKSWELVMKRL